MSRWPASMAATERIIFELLRELRQQGEDDHRRASRSPHGAPVFRLGRPPQHAAGGQRTGGGRTFTPENLRKTYGGRLAILDAAGEEAIQAGRRVAMIEQLLAYNTIVVLLGVSILGAGAGLVGSFCRAAERRALTGDASRTRSSAWSLRGVSNTRRAELDVHVCWEPWPAASSAIVIISALCRWTRVREDAAIGIVLSVFPGLGFALSRIIQNVVTSGSKAGAGIVHSRQDRRNDQARCLSHFGVCTVLPRGGARAV